MANFPGRKTNPDVLTKGIIPSFLGGFIGGIVAAQFGPFNYITLGICSLAGSATGLTFANRKDTPSGQLTEKFLAHTLISLPLVYAHIPGAIFGFGLGR
jgi:hypothetical protein